jgi:hypothetical protein
MIRAGGMHRMRRFDAGFIDFRHSALGEHRAAAVVTDDIAAGAKPA